MRLPRVIVAIAVVSLLLNIAVVLSESQTGRSAVQFSRESHETRGAPLDGRPLLAEVYYNTLVANEYVTLYNPCDEDIDISGWRLTDREGTIAFPSGAIVSSKGYVTVTQNSTLYRRDTLMLPDFSIDGRESPSILRLGGSFQLNNGGDEVLLENASGDIADAFIFGSSTYNGTGWVGRPAEALGKGYVSRRTMK